MKVAKWIIWTTLVLVSCNKENEVASKASAGKSPSSTPYEKGVCFDKVISPYVYQIAQVEGSKIFYFALGKADKEVMTSSVDILFKGDDPYQVIDCP